MYYPAYKMFHLSRIRYDFPKYVRLRFQTSSFLLAHLLFTLYQPLPIRQSAYKRVPEWKRQNEIRKGRGRSGFVSTEVIGLQRDN